MASGRAAQRSSKKDRNVGLAGQPVLAGSIYRGSHVVSDCVKLREAILFKDRLGMFGKHGSVGKSEKKHNRLDKVWVFASHHKLTQIRPRKFSALEGEKKRSLLSSLTSGHYTERELFTFSLISETRKGRSSGASVEKVDLAFDDEADAIRWRDAIIEQIAAIRRRERPSLSVGASQHLTQEVEEGGAVSGVAEARPANGNGLSSSAADEPCPEGFGTSIAASASEDVRSSEEEEQSVVERASSLEALQRDLHLDARGPSMDDWKVVSSENGITVLRGAGQHNASSIMLSFIVRAPPRLCVKTLLRREHHTMQVESLHMDMKVMETEDAFNDVLQTTWQPRGLERFFMAPRKLCVRRLWRREDDGSYVVIFKACEDPMQEPEPPWWNWFAPISCKLVDTCYTFSPLTAEYARSGDSNETLVTQVSCFGDMGGWMSSSHPWKLLLNVVAPFSANSWSSFIRPHVQSGIAIRNKAESERFCARPFLQSHDDGRGAPARSASSFQLDKLNTGPLPPQSSFATAAEEFSDASSYIGTASQPDNSDASAQELPRLQTNGHASSSSGSPGLTPAEVATCDRKYWSCPGANNLKVRGPNYLKDKKKIPAAEPIFTLIATDLLQVKKPTPHIAPFLPSLKASNSPFTFIMQIMFGNPSLSLTFSWAAPFPPRGEDADSRLSSLSSGQPGLTLGSRSGSYTDEDFAVDEGDLLGKPFELTLARFLAGGTNDAEANVRRHGTVKLIPRISQGAWFVKQAVGTTPCLLGRKLTTSYHRGPRYFEVDVDVSSSSVAANIVGLVQGMTRSLVVDMAIVLEGHSPEELPEQLLGTVRCAHLDLNSAKLLDTATGEITDKPANGKPPPKFSSRQTDPAAVGSTGRIASKLKANLHPIRSA